jgi:Mrr N-terminal domain
MRKKMTEKRSSESEITEAVLQVLSDTPSGELSTNHIVKRVPKHIELTAGDKVASETRPNEEVWEQIVRNIVSHKKTDGNAIAEGLLNVPSRGKMRITELGRLHVKNKKR